MNQDHSHRGDTRRLRERKDTSAENAMLVLFS